MGERTHAGVPMLRDANDKRTRGMLGDKCTHQGVAIDTGPGSYGSYRTGSSYKRTKHTFALSHTLLHE